MRRQTKKSGRILVPVVVGLLGLTLFGTSCGENLQNSDGSGTGGTGKYELWSTYNTVKVIRQTQKNDEYQKLPAELNIQMMKGEYEGAQLIITPQKDSTYTLKAGELKSGDGNTIPSENVAIYHQKYVTIDYNLNKSPDFTAGESIPDMLLPMDIAIKYKENVIHAGDNQGVTVEIDSTGVEPGIYTGNFELTIDGETQQIPVRVEVWNIEYTGRRTFKSSFLIYRENLVYGEYDNSYDVADRYIDFLAKYKIDTYVVRDLDSEKRFEESMEKYAANQNQASIVIPLDFKTDYKASSDNDQFKEAVGYIVKLAKASTEDMMYVEGAYFYPSSYDEADINESRRTPSEKFFGENGELEKTLKAAVEELKTDSEFQTKDSALKEKIYEAVLNIPAVFTNVNYVEDWVKTLGSATFCPYVNVYDDYATLQRYQDHAEADTNGNLWMYTANESSWPYPTLDIDDTALGLRVNGWMAKSAGVNGYLYWSVNCYYDGNNYVDVYGTPDRGFSANGDGFLVYPGYYYGSSTPFASVRLASFRDGLDDYDMLSVYENILDEKAEKYGFDYKFDDYVADLYTTLFEGTRSGCTDEQLFNIRAELADRILAEQSSENTVVKTRENGKTVLNVYTSSSDVKIDGAAVAAVASGSGYKYTVEYSGETAKTYTVSIDGKDYKYTVNGAKILSASTAKLSEGSTQTNGVINIKALDGEIIEILRPSIKFDFENVKADALHFSYENVGETEVTFRISLVTKTGKTVVSTNYCPAGKSRDVDVVFSDDVDWSAVTGIEISFGNVVLTDTGTSLSPDRTLKLGDLWFDLQ